MNVNSSGMATSWRSSFTRTDSASLGIIANGNGLKRGLVDAEGASRAIQRNARWCTSCVVLDGNSLARARGEEAFNRVRDVPALLYNVLRAKESSQLIYLRSGESLEPLLNRREGRAKLVCRADLVGGDTDAI